MAVPLFDTSTPLEPIDAEIRAKVNEIIDSKRFIFGPEVEAFEREFAAYIGTSHAVGVANGTDALLLALRALGVGPGDEVVVPSFTFFASAEPIVLVGATPVWCDIDPSTFVMTAEQVREVLTPRTKAVIAVHLFGNVAPIAEIEALGVPVIEDAAQSAGTSARRRPPPGRAHVHARHLLLLPVEEPRRVRRRRRGDDRTTPPSRNASRCCASTARTTSAPSNSSATTRASTPSRPASCACSSRTSTAGPTAAAPPHAPTRRPASASSSRSPSRPTAPNPPGISTSSKSERADELIGVLKDADIGTAAYYRVPAHLQPAMRDYPPTVELPGTEEAARTNLAMPMSPVLDRAQADEVVAAVGALAPVFP